MNDTQKRAWLQRTFKLDIVVVFSSLIVVTMAEEGTPHGDVAEALRTVGRRGVPRCRFI